MQKELSKIKDPALHQWASAAVGAAVGGIVGGKTGTQSGAGTAAMGTKENYFREDKKPMRIEIVLWRSPDEKGRYQIPHIALRTIYDDGKNDEIHFGNYTSRIPQPIGEGTIVDINSVDYTDKAIANGEAIILDQITQPEEINEVIYRGNYYMRAAEEYKGKDVIGKLRKSVVDRFGVEKIDAIYKDKGYFTRYDLFTNDDCLSFVQKIVGDSSQKVKKLPRIRLKR
jgi:hypothetical protein